MCLWLGGAALAQGDLRISGHVTDGSGAVMQDVQIVLTEMGPSGVPTSSARVIRSKTNKKGKFTFAFAKPGDYLLSVEGSELQVVSATVKIRGADRKPVYAPEGMIEDRTSAVPAANPTIGLGIPGDAFYVTVDLTLGEPPPAATTAGADEVAEQIVGSGLGQDVEAILAKFEARQFQAGLGEVEALIADDPELAPLHYLKGFALVKLGRLAPAETALRRALELDPDIEGVPGLLGRILGEQGRYEEAVTALSAALERAERPEQRAPLTLALGQALLETGQVERAVTVLEEAYSLNGQNETSRVQLVDAYIRAGRDEDAERVMGEDMQSEQAAALHYNLAANLLRAEQWEKGAHHMELALALQPGLAEAHKHLAQAYLAQGDRERALAEYEAYLAQAPEAEDAEQTGRLIDMLRRSLAQK